MFICFFLALSNIFFSTTLNYDIIYRKTLILHLFGNIYYKELTHYKAKTLKRQQQRRERKLRQMNANATAKLMKVISDLLSAQRSGFISFLHPNRRSFSKPVHHLQRLRIESLALALGTSLFPLPVLLERYRNYDLTFRRE